jgi:hypothetical protein
MPQRSGYLFLPEPGAIVAFQQQRHPITGGKVAGLSKRGIKALAFLEQHALLLERRDCAEAARPAVDPISHRRSPFVPAPKRLIGRIVPRRACGNAERRQMCGERTFSGAINDWRPRENFKKSWNLRMLDLFEPAGKRAGATIGGMSR